MVTTRSSGANTAPISYLPLRPSKRRKPTDVNTLKQSRDPGSIRSILRTASTPTVGTAQSRPSSEMSGLAPTSPPHGRLPRSSAATAAYPSNPIEAKLSTEQILAALKELTTPGTSQNPIVLLEDSPSKGIQSPSKVEPHVFRDRHSKLYTYIGSRPALAPRPANGRTFTGSPGQDMFRMRAAKMATNVWHAGIHEQNRQDLPFAKRHLPSQPGGHRYVPTSISYFPHPPPAYPQYAVPTPLNEEHLRSKALQYVREYSRSSPRKRKMAQDPDETSESDSTEVYLNVGPSLREPVPKPIVDDRTGVKTTRGPLTTLPDPHFQLKPLIEQASLLTSLLRVYPQSRDQKGIRDDIALLASVQNQHLADWLNFEVGQAKKVTSPHTPRVSRTLVSPAILGPRLPTVAEAAEAERIRRDDEVRELLSADAEVWRDGSGLSVADVYSDSASTPQRCNEGAQVESSPAARTSGRKRVTPARCKNK